MYEYSGIVKMVGHWFPHSKWICFGVDQGNPENVDYMAWDYGLKFFSNGHVGDFVAPVMGNSSFFPRNLQRNRGNRQVSRDPWRGHHPAVHPASVDQSLGTSPRSSPSAWPPGQGRPLAPICSLLRIFIGFKIEWDIQPSKHQKLD